MIRPKYVASCSGGKDSVATLLLAAQHNEPLDEAVFSEVMFDKDTSGEIPEHRDFIYDRLKPFCEKELGVKFTILHADKTYDDVFHHVITRGPHRARFAVLRGLECARSIGTAKSRPSESTIPRFLRVLCDHVQQLRVTGVRTEPAAVSSDDAQRTPV